jgi:sulfonate transport system substrate-binding protein
MSGTRLKRIELTAVMKRFRSLLFVSPLIALLAGSAVYAQKAADLAPLRASGALYIELSPLLMAANGAYPGPITMAVGGIPLIVSGQVDVATNAETQLLRQSVDNPDLRVIFTVAESFYRIVGKRSAGIRSVADLKGKRITVPRNTSAHYYLFKMLATAKLTEADVTLVNIPGNETMKAMTDGRLDAMVGFEPEPERARELLGNDAIILQDKRVYRELFNLNTSAKVLADPAKRQAVVELVRTLIATSKQWSKNPAPALPLISAKLNLPAELILKAKPEIRYAGGMVKDLLDVLEEEEKWVATERNRQPRTRAQLATLIDASVLEEARRKR